jgi:uncharacterized membrane protein HdeD (DUF308 family)
MLTQYIEHRWICWVQGGLAFSLGVALLGFGHLMSDFLTNTFAVALALLCSGFVLLAVGLMDLAVAMDVTARRHSMRSALVWWIPGCIGIIGGAGLLMTPRMTMGLLAIMAAVHAILIACMDLTMLQTMHSHRFLYYFLMISGIGFAVFGALLLVGSLSSEAMAARVVGSYAIAFGARFLYLGWEFSSLRPLDLTMARPR